MNWSWSKHAVIEALENCGSFNKYLMLCYYKYERFLTKINIVGSFPYQCEEALNYLALFSRPIVPLSEDHI